MIRFCTFFLFFLLVSSTSAQQSWQEHLSHDRLAYHHHGHFLIDGQIVLVMGNLKPPMNTLEPIVGNTKKVQEVIGNRYTFESKTTITDVNAKEVLLIRPFDYDIPGIGAFSLHQFDDNFLTRDIQGDFTYNGDEISVIDASMLGGLLDPKECVSYDKRYVLSADDQIISETDLDGTQVRFHEGLDGLSYQIEDGVFRRISLPFNGNIDLGAYSRLVNNPFKFQLIEIENHLITRYSYDDLSLIGTEALIDNPLDIQFDANGFYYLTESEESYIVYYFSDNTSESDIYFELPKDDEIGRFEINSIEVVEDDIYFLGLWRSPLSNRSFSYVQKRTKDVAFTPTRKDMGFVDVTATRELIDETEYMYTYDITVENLSNDTIRHFTIYHEILQGEGPLQHINEDISIALPPNGTHTIQGEYEFNYYPKNALTFTITGVDFGIDSDMSNNSITAEVVILSNKNTAIQNFSIAPNPSSDVIFLKGDTYDIKSLFISSVSGQKVELSTNVLNEINISSLPQGKYWLEIITKSGVEKHPFMKI